MERLIERTETNNVTSSLASNEEQSWPYDGLPFISMLHSNGFVEFKQQNPFDQLTFWTNFQAKDPSKTQMF